MALMVARSLDTEMGIMDGGSCAVAGFLCELVTDAGTPHAGFSSKEIRSGTLGATAKRLIAGGQVRAGNPAFFKPIFYEKRVATGAWVKFVYHETAARSHIIKYVLFLQPPSATDLANFQTAVGVRLRIAEGNWILFHANGHWNATQAGPPVDLAYQQARHSPRGGPNSASKRPRPE